MKESKKLILFYMLLFILLCSSGVVAISAVSTFMTICGLIEIGVGIYFLVKAILITINLINKNNE